MVCRRCCCSVVFPTLVQLDCDTKRGLEKSGHAAPPQVDPNTHLRPQAGGKRGRTKAASQTKRESGKVTFGVSPERRLVEANAPRQSLRPVAPGPGPQPTAANPLMTSATCAGTEASRTAQTQASQSGTRLPPAPRAFKATFPFG